MLPIPVGRHLLVPLHTMMQRRPALLGVLQYRIRREGFAVPNFLECGHHLVCIAVGLIHQLAGVACVPIFHAPFLRKDVVLSYGLNTTCVIPLKSPFAIVVNGSEDGAGMVAQSIGEPLNSVETRSNAVRPSPESSTYKLTK